MTAGVEVVETTLPSNRSQSVFAYDLGNAQGTNFPQFSGPHTI